MATSQDDSPLDLKVIHSRYGKWIRARLRALFPRDWEDMSQDVMVRAAKGLAALRDTSDETVRAWISRALRSVCVDEIRKRARRPAATQAAEELTASDPTASSATAHKEDVARLMDEAWGTLSRREREILALRFRDGLSFRQIAEVLGAPQGSVAGWYSRALVRLRELME